MKTFILCALALAAVPAAAQRAPVSLQGNAGTIGGIGGNAGLSVELALHPNASATFAIGTSLDSKNGTAPSFPLDFSVGARVYPFQRWLYGELAYGFVDLQTDYDEATDSYGALTKERAVSYALGVRSPAWRGVYAGASIGGALGDEARFPFNGSPLSRVGLTLGIELGR